MKNIHVLKTDKPSRLHFTEFFEELVFTPKYEKLDGVNIYITSDEEIKDSYVINTQKNKIYFENWYSSTSFIKKIILTTDIDLIKDGVQAIDDEFLEWFIQNPSCGEVEVEVHKMCYGALSGFSDAGYKIIIPKEEQSYICPKTNQNCDDEMCDSASNCNIDNPLITDSKELNFEEISNQFHQIANDFKHPFEEYEMKSCKTYSDNQEIMPKQETLEEVAPMEELVIILHKIKKNLTNKTEVLTIKLITDTIKTQFVDKELKWQQKTIEEVFEWLTTNNYLTDLKETLIENFKNK